MGLESRLEELFQRHPEIQRDGERFTTNKSKIVVRLPTTFTQDICRIIGIIHGDGNMSCRRFHITDKNREYHKYLQELFRRTFNINLNVFHDKNRNSFYSYSKNSIVYKYLTEVLEIPEGAVRKFHIPNFLEKLPLELQGEYVAGIFDSEGHIRKRQAEIDFTTTNQGLWEFLKNFLKKINVKFSERVRHRRRNPEFEVIIYGKHNLQNFCKFVKLKHPEKIERMSLFLPH